MWEALTALGKLALEVIGLVKPSPRPADAPLTVEEAHAARVGTASGAQASREGKIAPTLKRPPAR